MGIKIFAFWHTELRNVKGIESLEQNQIFQPQYLKNSML